MPCLSQLWIKPSKRNLSNDFCLKCPDDFFYGKLAERAAKRDGWTSLKLWRRGHGKTGCIGFSLYPCDPNHWSRISETLHPIVGGARPTDQGDDVEFLNPRFGERNLECSLVGNKNLLPKISRGQLIDYNHSWLWKPKMKLWRGRDSVHGFGHYHLQFSLSKLGSNV